MVLIYAKKDGVVHPCVPPLQVSSIGTPPIITPMALMSDTPAETGGFNTLDEREHIITLLEKAK